MPITDTMTPLERQFHQVHRGRRARGEEAAEGDELHAGIPLTASYDTFGRKVA